MIRLQATPPTMKRSILTVFLIAVTSCGGSSGSSTPPGSGVVQDEAEGNDSPGSPQDLGTLAPGATLSVRGDVTAFGADTFDVYRFEATAATSVGLELEAEGATADLDAWLANESGQVLERFEDAGTANESGTFALAAGEVALLVVTAADVDANYLVTLTGG